MRIVFLGSIGRFPVGGHAWADLQYLLGLRALGHDVLYVEDCGAESWVYNWHTEQMTTELDYPANYVRDSLGGYGFAERWSYRAGDVSRGCDEYDVAEFCAAADLLLIRAVPIAVWRSAYRDIPRRVFIDADPLFTQVQLAHGKEDLCETVDRCDHLFTIGQRLGKADCPAPLSGRTWHRTVSPVFLDEWPYVAADDAVHFTSVLQWRSYREVEFAGNRYGNKDKEFPQFVDLPRRTRAKLRVALTGSPPGELTSRGWDVVCGWKASESTGAYRDFIQQSRGEFGIAKHGYVASRCGWFSDRSVCYLASGRPVILQDTGLADWLPLGRGVLTFADFDQAAQALETVNAEYQMHRRAARWIAETHFNATRTLPTLLETAMA